MKKINSKLPIVLILSILILLMSCAKDKLVDDLSVFKGRYTWEYSKYKKHLFSSSLTTHQATSSNYKAEVEFTDNGKVIFYIDGEEIHKTGYSIKNQEVINGSTISLEIDPRNEDSKQLDLNDKISFSLTNNDTLTNSQFPGDSYDNTLAGTHYFIRN